MHTPATSDTIDKVIPKERGIKRNETRIPPLVCCTVYHITHECGKRESVTSFKPPMRLKPWRLGGTDKRQSPLTGVLKVIHDKSKQYKQLYIAGTWMFPAFRLSCLWNIAFPLRSLSYYNCLFPNTRRCPKTTKPRTSNNVYSIKKNSVALVRERTIPTERPPLVGEVSDNFCG